MTSEPVPEEPTKDVPPPVRRILEFALRTLAVPVPPERLPSTSAEAFRVEPLLTVRPPRVPVPTYTAVRPDVLAPPSRVSWGVSKALKPLMTWKVLPLLNVPVTVRL